jgi:uncharacterized protein YecE (DUF72 family)
MRLHVGTSGYNYPEWRGTFYPAEFPTSKMFAFYAERFTTVEVNYTFYRMPTLKTTAGWHAQAPAGFQYTLKTPRRITHDKRLKECGEDLRFFCDAALGLGEHLGVLLLQLPPNLKCDVDRLRAALAVVPAGIRTAFEFRHESWLVDPVYEALREHQAALCIADFGDKTTPIVATARHGYFRLRDEGYEAGDLDRWAERIAAHADEWDDVFVYFKHEDEGKGPEFARAFCDYARARQLTLA